MLTAWQVFKRKHSCMLASQLHTHEYLFVHAIHSNTLILSLHSLLKARFQYHERLRTPGNYLFNIYAPSCRQPEEIKRNWRNTFFFQGLWSKTCTRYQIPHMPWDYSRHNSFIKSSIVRVVDHSYQRPCTTSASFHLQKNTFGIQNQSDDRRLF